MPDGDFLQAIAAGQVSVVTDEIENFTENGIQLKSGKLLEANLIVTGRHRPHHRRRPAGLFRLRPEDEDMPLLPWIDPENFNPGYLVRGMHLLPKRGAKPEWQHTQDYWSEKDEFPAIDLGGREFSYA